MSLLVIALCWKCCVDLLLDFLHDTCMHPTTWLTSAGAYTTARTVDKTHVFGFEDHVSRLGENQEKPVLKPNHIISMPTHQNEAMHSIASHRPQRILHRS